MGYREQLNECTDPVSGDWLEITNVGNATDKDQKLNVGRLAILANAQSFTAAQTFATAAGTTPISVTTPTNQTEAGIGLSAADCGSSYGPYIVIGRNSNGVTPSAGWLRLYRRDNNTAELWPDATGVWRTSVNGAPSNATDTGGTVVGSQTSWIGTKEDISEWTDPQQALDAVLAAKLFHYHLKGDATKRQYSGLVISDSDRGSWFSENDAEHQVPALNERNLFGYLIGAVQALSAQVEQLKAEVEALRNA